MSIRMRRQSPRKELHAVDSSSPGPGMYNVGTDRDIGRTKSRMQEWKSPMRKVEWFLRKTESADVSFPQMMDHNGIARLSADDLIVCRMRITVMIIHLPISRAALIWTGQDDHQVGATAQNDDGDEEQSLTPDVLGRQEAVGENQLSGCWTVLGESREFQSFSLVCFCRQIFQVIPPYFASYNLGPGSYVVQDDREIGKTKSRMQEWYDTEVNVREVAAERDELVQQDERCSFRLVRLLALEVR
ncbi:hypothetical protein GUITHDRAFT_139609 [Guillardia theta CCMP2712]|uniref:Uncharacterized protein n=1 Tax=Guillardia theta (strain CCMP2712) TaxID=905079 RepID=L1J8M0_GUITC|nr:hypothetical protein GUITHDRAFT_139609 [Guillardia theta CCMP2712]EKX44682.1 hypothetical protein GUITHDRAFT_139609 [Guillardia theta CCMP2712]|eukprot:XP_005831662.1 hypothetical protein GUITHDRAFT_139609 [Guillardia theta CCMP2712]